MLALTKEEGKRDQKRGEETIGPPAGGGSVHRVVRVNGIIHKVYMSFPGFSTYDFPIIIGVFAIQRHIGT